MFTLSVKFRASTRQGDNPGRLFFRIIHNRRTTEVASEIKVFINEWNTVKDCIDYNHANKLRKQELEKLAKNLDEEKTALYKDCMRLIKDGVFDISKVKPIHQLRKNKNSFVRFVDYLSQEQNALGKYRTARAYQSMKRCLLKFNKGYDFLLDDIQASFIQSLEKELQQKGLTLNTISFYLRNLRAVHNKAIHMGYVDAKTVSVFKGTFTGVEVTKKRALSKDEIQTLINFDISIGTSTKFPTTQKQIAELELTRDMFAFSFLARGMSFVDTVLVRRDSFKGDVLTYFRHKTKQKLEIIITHPLRQIINKYLKQNNSSPYLFPVIRRAERIDGYKDYLYGLQKQNRNLKILANQAQIFKPVTTHVSRHSWATIAKKEEVAIWVISEALGHSSIKTTYTYLDSFDKSKLAEANNTVLRAVGF